MRGDALRIVVLLAVIVVAILFVREPAEAAESVTQIIYEEAARYGVSGDWLYWTAYCETGGTFNQGKVGAQGEIGVMQWHPRGLWSSIPIFRSWADVYDLRLNIRGAAYAFSIGLSYHWTCS